MKRCDFCGELRELTLASAYAARAGVIQPPPSRICAPCVWRCADKLVAHASQLPVPERREP